MATLNIPSGTNLTYYDDLGNFLSATPLNQDATLTDNDGGDAQFTPGENLIFTIGTAPGLSATYLGLAEGLPNPALVIRINTIPPNWIVLNRALDSTSFPDFASLAVDQTEPFDVAPCFATGTRIATQGGWIDVQNLAPGTEVLTADGRIVPVLWLGRKTIMPAFARAEHLALVRIRADALGQGLPARDLVMTADHAICIDGLLVHAGALVNGDTVQRVPMSGLGASVIVYHVETEAHDLILAEGTPCETYIDYTSRRAFDNHAEFEARFPDGRAVAELDIPRITSARHLPPTLRDRLGLRRIA